jgi:hypothetical protein
MGLVETLNNARRRAIGHELNRQVCLVQWKTFSTQSWKPNSTSRFFDDDFDRLPSSMNSRRLQNQPKMRTEDRKLLHPDRTLPMWQRTCFDQSNSLLMNAMNILRARGQQTWPPFFTLEGRRTTLV